MRKISLVAFIGVLFFSCSKEKNLIDVELEKGKIKEFLLSNDLGTGSVKFTDSLSKDNAMVFNSLEEFKNFVESAKNTSKIVSNRPVLSSYRSNRHIPTKFFSCAKEIRGTLGLLSLSTSGYYKKISAMVIEDAHLISSIVGVTLGLSYEHTRGNMFYSRNELRFEGAGLINYNLIISDIGTVYTESIEFSGVINEDFETAQFDDYYRSPAM